MGLLRSRWNWLVFIATQAKAVLLCCGAFESHGRRASWSAHAELDLVDLEASAGFAWGQWPLVESSHDSVLNPLTICCFGRCLGSLGPGDDGRLVV